MEHTDRTTYEEIFYNGKKESEIPYVRYLLNIGLVVINFLMNEKLQNIRVQLELFVYDFQFLIQWMRQKMFYREVLIVYNEISKDKSIFCNFVANLG